MSLVCGHCGSEVQAGFKVCSGCGAHYRGNTKSIVWGVIFILGGLIAVADGYWIGLLVIALGGVGIWFGFKKQWYRYNA